MRNLIFVVLALALLVLGSCTSVETELGGVLGTRGGGIHRFHATTEQSAPETKVYADEQLRVLWNEGDLLSVFNQSTYNSKFEFAGEDGDNAGDFEDVTPSGLHSGNSLSNIYAVYPYDKGNKINNDGNTITLTLPAEQQYKEHSFGIGSNTMVAVTDNSFLAFKNIGGYLQLRLYGDNVSVSSITIQGNNGEKIAGKANVAVGLGVTPTVTMDGTATETITLVCDPPVQLGTTAEQYTDFWFVIPPVTFSGGFTITVTDELGGTFEKSTSKSLTISRSTIEWMSALEVVPNYDNVNVVFADANFKAYCVENFDTNGDDEISVAEALLVTSITVNPEVVASLKGIEYFTNLQSLDCHLQYNRIDASGNVWHYYRNGEEVFSLLSYLDLSKNTALTSLDCSYCQLNGLDVSNDTALDRLSCVGNQLTSLDLSHNTALSFLNCGSNQLTSLDLSHNTELTSLWCDHNQLISLDVSHNTALSFLNCGSNQLTSLDVRNNTALTVLWCDENQLTSLDVNYNTALTNLLCARNQLTSLDVSHNTALIKLVCFDNQLTSIVIGNNTALKQLGCERNQLTSLDVRNNTALTELGCDSNQLTSLDVSNNTLLKELDCSSNQLNSLDVSHNIAITWLWCSNNQLSSLDVSYNTALTDLGCAGNELTSLDVSNNTLLEKLYCTNNPDLFEIWLKDGQTIAGLYYDPDISVIKYIDDEIVPFEDANFKAYCVDNFDTDHDGEISYAEAWLVTRIYCADMNIQSLSGIEYFKDLTILNCAVNQLTSLDVSKNIALDSLGCGSNNLSTLDVSHNTALNMLRCENNKLTSLDVSHNTALTSLSCDGNQLTSLDVSHSTSLRQLYCYDNQLTSLDISHNTALTSLHCYSNQLTSLNVSHNTALSGLYCYNNQLTSLDVSHNTALTMLHCYSNQLTSLDVSHNTALAGLYCYNNQLTSLDVSHNTALTRLECSNNQLTSLDVSSNTALTWLRCDNNPYLIEIWLKTNQTINQFYYDTEVATIKRKD